MHLRFLIVLFILNSYLFFFNTPEDRKPEIFFFDVGQGDAILFRTAGGYKGLIDGGPHRKILEYLGKNLSYFDRKIDIVILTHPHQDHIKGLLEVLKKYDISLVMITGVKADSSLYTKFLSELKARNTPLLVATSSNDIIFKDNTILDIVYPASTLEGLKIDDVNSTSIVIRLTHGAKKVLLTGDTTIQNEGEMIRSPLELRADILKIAHHGSKTSTSDEFLAVVKPKTAIISSGRGNRFGHPHREVLQRLNQGAIEIRRTDIQGTIELPL